MSDTILQTAARFKGVVIENMDAIKLTQRTDRENTLFYVDPPYLHSTRSSVTSSQKYYRHEMTDEEHEELLQVLVNLKGKVIVSGYMSDLYDGYLSEWDRYTFKSRAATQKGTVMREEIVWVSPSCSGEGNGRLF